MEILGHIIGFVSIAMFFCSYQVRNKKSLLIIQIIATVLLCLQYVLIKAYSGFAMNTVCIARCITYYYVDTKKGFGKYCPYILSFAILPLAIISWEGCYSLFLVMGLMVNTVLMGFLDIQKFRVSVWFTSSLLLAYNLFAGSYSGMIGDVMTISSAVIGYVRYKNNKSGENI